MRYVQIPPTPPSLSSREAMQERNDVASFYAVPSNATRKYDGEFRAYKADDVKDALHSAFHGKCAYCESPIEATQPHDVEHYRPKGGVKINGKLERPGYHWLASRWENLLPSCNDCNRPRRQDFPGGHKPATAGKGNQFPISSEHRRAKAAGEERRERPLLIHPYFDDPAKHLEYVWTKPGTPEQGEVLAYREGTRRSRRGQSSIDVYALQRLGLIRQRAERLTLLLGVLEGLANMRELIEKRGGDSGLEALFDEKLREVNKFLGPNKAYSAMCEQVVLAYKPKLFP